MLAAISMNVALVAKERHKLSSDGSRRIEENGALIQQASADIRTVSYLLHPPLLDEMGLRSALKWYIEGFAERSKMNVILEIASRFGTTAPGLGVSHISYRAGMPNKHSSGTPSVPPPSSDYLITGEN